MLSNNLQSGAVMLTVNDVNEVFSKCTKLAMLALKAYVREHKKISKKTSNGNRILG